MARIHGTAAGRDDGSSFDYVIVGAGSAGCVLANRLSADPSVSVCLVEAGPADRSPLIHIPFGLAGLLRHPRLNWCYETVPQAHAGGRAIPMPTGRVLGGTSSINGMVYMRGHRRDYDDWARQGNAGWAFRDVLPYFLRSENNETFRNSSFHGIGGPLNVTDLRAINAISRKFIEAATSLQFPLCEDFNGPENDGFGYRQVTQRGGRRASTAVAFLEPARRRPNLHVFKDTITERVTFSDLRATGIDVRSTNGANHLRVRREVILSAGALNSPMILMRSGIGDAQHLVSRGIAPLLHSPQVGRNLHDHPAIALQFRTDHTGPYGISWKVLPRLAWNGLHYLLLKGGPIAGTGLEAGGFVRSRPGLDRPDIQYTFMAAPNNRNYKVGFGHGYALTTILLQSGSRGEVRMSADDLYAPNIDPRFFECPDDLETLLRGLKIGRQIMHAPAFAEYRGEELRPGTEVRTDDDLRAYIVANSGTGFHPVGTCKMGVGEDAVVDPTLRVRGVDSLRVVDASIMPAIVSGNTNAPAIMIGEKAADMILGKTPCQPIDLYPVE